MRCRPPNVAGGKNIVLLDIGVPTPGPGNRGMWTTHKYLAIETGDVAAVCAALKGTSYNKITTANLWGPAIDHAELVSLKALRKAMTKNRRKVRRENNALRKQRR